MQPGGQLSETADQLYQVLFPPWNKYQQLSGIIGVSFSFSIYLFYAGQMGGKNLYGYHVITYF